MKKFTQFFGGAYQKYWYMASGVVLIIMALSMYNNRSVDTFELTVYNADGSVESTQTVDKLFISMENDKMGVSKKYVPIKQF